MDELEIRRRIYADPNDASDEIKQLCNDNAQFQELKNDMLDFDKKLLRAMQVDVPENLQERIILNQKLKSPTTSKVWRSHFAIAASIAALFALTISIFRPFSERHTLLVDHSLAHLQNEVGHIPAETKSSLDELNDKLANFGAKVIDNVNLLKNVRFASFCTFQGTRSLHVIFKDDEQDVTVFVVPKNSGLIAQTEAQKANLYGKNVSMINADVVVVGNNKATVNKWVSEISSALQWQKV